jgi:hypothetical protein
VRQSYVAPDEVDTATQISELEIDLRKAKDSGKKVAPGFYAHLGMMYAIKIDKKAIRKPNFNIFFIVFLDFSWHAQACRQSVRLTLEIN